MALYQVFEYWILAPLAVMAHYNYNKLEMQFQNVYKIYRPHHSLVTRFVIVAWVVVNMVILSLVLSIVMFGSVYFQYKPKVYTTVPLEFEYKR